MVDFEVRELRYFRAVAEELNFTKAAERLGIAQPPLSRAIRQLERRLGVPLFHRAARRITLTAAGRTLVVEADRVLAAVAAAAHRTARAGADAPALLVTAKPGVTTDLLRQVIAEFGELPGSPAIEVIVSGIGQQADMVRDGRADVALLGSPYQADDLDVEVLYSEPRVVALPAGHELTQRSVLSRADLAGLPIPRCMTERTALARTYWTGRDNLDDPGPDPTGPVAWDTAQILESVALGQAVALVPAAIAASSNRKEIAYRPVRDVSPYTTAIAWPSGSRDPWIAQLVRIAVKLAADRDPSGLADSA